MSKVAPETQVAIMETANTIRNEITTALNSVESRVIKNVSSSMQSIQDKLVTIITKQELDSGRINRLDKELAIAKKDISDLQELVKKVDNISEVMTSLESAITNQKTVLAVGWKAVTIVATIAATGSGLIFSLLSFLFK